MSTLTNILGFVSRQLHITIATNQPQIPKTIIATITVYMIHHKRNWFATPLSNKAHLTLNSSLFNKVFLESCWTNNVTRLYPLSCFFLLRYIKTFGRAKFPYMLGINYVLSTTLTRLNFWYETLSTTRHFVVECCRTRLITKLVPSFLVRKKSATTNTIT